MAIPPVDPSASEAEAVLRDLELTVTRRLSGLLHGEVRGLLPGTGSEPADTRPYEPGDDVRRIDWAATARSGTTQLRTTVEDRELSCYLVADASGSMDFGTATTSKRYVVTAALSAFGFLAARGANRVGGTVVAGEQWRWFPPAAGRTTLRTLLDGAMRDRGEGRCDLGGALEATGRAARHRGLVVVASDFVGVGDFARPLAMLSRHHDVVAVEVVDPRERELVDVGVVTFADPETGRQVVVDTSRRSVRESFAARRADQRAELADVLRSARVSHLVLDCDRNWLDQVVGWLHLRRVQRWAGVAQ